MKNCVEHTPEVWSKIFVIYPFSSLAIERESKNGLKKETDFFWINEIKEVQFLWKNNHNDFEILNDNTWNLYCCENWTYSDDEAQAIIYRDKKNKENLKEVAKIILWENFFSDLELYIKTVNNTIFLRIR